MMAQRAIGDECFVRCELYYHRFVQVCRPRMAKSKCLRMAFNNMIGCNSDCMDSPGYNMARIFRSLVKVTL
ncbi:unnamed protein product [Dicrocoelium dendriticum]|nr:unnamed protein product [Dicrocoelium dendriticum]